MVNNFNVHAVRIPGWDGSSSYVITSTASNPDDLLDPLQSRCRIMGYGAVGAEGRDILIKLSETTGGTVRIELDIARQDVRLGGPALLDMPSDGVLFHTGVFISAFKTDGTSLTNPDAEGDSIQGITLYYQV